MTHQYKIQGMTCGGCLAKVKGELLKHPKIISAEVSLPDAATITMNEHITLYELQQTIGTGGKYVIHEDDTGIQHHVMQKEQTTSWLKTYKPLLLIFLFIVSVSFITSIQNDAINTMRFMQNFMAGFFLVFSFFKFINLKGFAESYAMYDVLAKKINVYGFIYPFIELSLGIAYLTALNLALTNIVTILVMGFSSIGVFETLVSKKKIKCACLGDVFNLPMSTITLTEDLLMVAMSLFMLLINSI